jgi:hypothetical protein
MWLRLRRLIEARIIDDLYNARGAGLERAVADALIAVGLTVTRILRQPHGEEDVRSIIPAAPS